MAALLPWTPSRAALRPGPPVQPRLVSQQEPRTAHRLDYRGAASQQMGIEGDVGIEGEGWDGEAGVLALRVNVDRLGTHQDDGVAVGSQCLHRVEQRLAGGYPGLATVSFHLSSLSCIHSSRASASAGPRPGPFIRSSSTWVTRA